MARINTEYHSCELFRFNNGYCDVFIEDDHYLFAECECYYMRYPFPCTCKEYKRAKLSDRDIAIFSNNKNSFIVSDYAGASVEYLQTLEYAPEDIAAEIIASEERYTLECMAHEYGYTRQYIIDCYLKCIADGDNEHNAFIHIACCMMEYDL